MLPPTLRRRRAYATPTHTPMAPLHPLDSATATLVGATPVNASSPICLQNDEHSSSEKVRVSPDVQLESSTATSVLGGGGDEHELEHEGSHHAAASMNLSMRVEDTEHACVNTTPMNGGSSSPLKANTTPTNGGGSSPLK